MRAFKFCRYCLQKYFLIPSNFDEKKYHCILRAIPWEFWDEVFSLKIWGHFIQQWFWQTLGVQTATFFARSYELFIILRIYQGRRNVWGHKDWSSPCFQDSVNPISTRGADYAHHSTTVLTMLKYVPAALPRLILTRFL